MKASELLKTLKTALQNAWPILVQSSPGMGKSDLGNEAVRQLAYDLITVHPVVEEPTDAKGLPAIVNGVADFLPYGNLRAMMEATRPLVVFLDDLGQAPQSVQAAYMQLLLAREINGKKISEHVRFVAATNRRADNAGVSGLITPLLSRFRATLELHCDATDWQKWALQNGMPLELVAFIGFKPDRLSTFDPKQARDMKPFACPRTLAFLGQWLNAGIDDMETVCGCVGETFAVEFMGFRQIYKEVAGLPAKVVLNPQTTEIPAKPDILFALSAALSYNASAKNIDAIGIYTERIPSEMRTFFWKSATARKPELCESNAFINWTVRNPDDAK
jgi:hypothetical protein